MTTALCLFFGAAELKIFELSENNNGEEAILGGSAQPTVDRQAFIEAPIQRETRIVAS